ncbi:MAG TPA: glycosyltransferase family 4 protein [Candidatus Hydrogenedentes bacterium]|nr:glycosyltransferase family 4 protein [Candidatus Hydrogenedentota bacterium]HOL76772.1 glycosyltransferase family 4 protein [Candidatus Hydrogenedentota bacterium]HPO85267.1 glycosyltransferase family 4 protein [Candidatus Hydrogenedentota bacterium]
MTRNEEKRVPRILVFHYNSNPTLHGAALKCTNTLAAAGYQVTLVKLAPRREAIEAAGGDRSAQQLVPGATLRQVRLVSRNLPRFALPIIKFLEMLIRFFWIALRESCDVIMGFDPPAVLPAFIGGKLSGKPVLHFALELYPEQHWVVGKSIWRFISRFLGPRVDALVVVDANRAEYMVQHYRARNPVVIHNTPPYRTVERTDLLPRVMAERGLSATKAALYQGQVEAERGIGQMIEAAKYLRDDTAIVILGKAESDYEAEIHRQIRAAGVENKVLLLPPVLSSEVWQYTASAHCGLILHLPISLNFVLNVGATNKLYEYLMAGIPVVTVNYPGYPELVEGERVGKCVDPTNPKAIADAVNEMLADGQEWEQLRQRALRLAREQFNWEIDAAKFLDTVRSLIRKSVDTEGG